MRDCVLGWIYGNSKLYSGSLIRWVSKKGLGINAVFDINRNFFSALITLQVFNAALGIRKRKITGFSKYRKIGLKCKRDL